MSDVPIGQPCPTCGKPSIEAYAPFCSKRCTDVDLQRWLTGRYAIPAEPDEEHPDLESDEFAGQPGPRPL